MLFRDGRFQSTATSNLNPNRSHRPTAAERSKLYVLITKPTIDRRIDTCEYTLELVVPPISRAPSGASTPTSLKHSFFSQFSRKHGTASQPITPPPEDHFHGQKSLSTQRYYFSRLHHDTTATSPPPNTILRICLPTVPPTHSQHDSPSIAATISQALETVHTTPDALSWLQQACTSLQQAHVTPSVSHGFEVPKFTGFTTSYLESHLRELEQQEPVPTTTQSSSGSDSVSDSPEPHPIKEVNYARMVRENARLKRMMSSDATDYQVLDPSMSRDSHDEDEDEWHIPTLPERPGRNHEKRKSHLGGFWVTQGSGRTADDRSRSQSRNRVAGDLWANTRTNAYGGLM